MNFRLHVPSHMLKKMKPRKMPTIEDEAAYSLAEYYGLYAYTCDTDDPSSSALRKLASTVSSSVIGITSVGLGFRPYHSSGIIVVHNRKKLILTSGYILGDGSKTPKITVILCNQKEVDADIEYIDTHHNVILLRANLGDETTVARFSTDLPSSGTSVAAVGRHYLGRPMASWGSINFRQDHLESDDLMSSNSNISEWGIGGPLIDRFGNVLGMNFFSKKGYTPFMPSNIILKCVKHLIELGSVCRPWLGLRTRCLEETDSNEFQCGVVVKEVAKGSPAEKAGIFVGDIVTSCNRTTLSSPAQFAGVLFRSVESNRGNVMPPERRETLTLNVQLCVRSVSDGTQQSRVLHIKRFTPPVSNSWPVLPIPTS